MSTLDYSGSHKTLIAGQSLDVSATDMLIEKIIPYSVLPTAIARASGNTTGKVSDLSTTGVYVGGSATSIVSTIYGPWDKVTCSSGIIHCVLAAK